MKEGKMTSLKIHKWENVNDGEQWSANFDEQKASLALIAEI